MSDLQTSHSYRFGAFELDLGAAKLRKHGIRVRLSKLPFQALAHLAENPGRLVSREDLHRLLWGDETAEGFDDNLNHVIQRIREALDDDHKDPQFIETAPGMGYRFIAEVRAPSAKNVSREAVNAADTAPGVPRLTWALAALGLVAGLVILALWPSPETPAPTSGRPSIVVLPFENVGDPADEYFADGMTEEIITRLAGVEGLSVTSRTSAMQYKVGRPSLKQIGQELGVDYALEGTVRWQRSDSGPGRVRVTPQLIHVAADEHVWAESYDGVLTDIFEVQSDIASQVLANLNIVLVEPQLRSLQARPTSNAAAYDAYLRGNEYFHRAREVHSENEIRIAIRIYQEAIDLDPSFALAHARQAVAHGWLAMWNFDRTEERLTLAAEASARAISLDPDLPDAHFALGQISASGHDWGRAIEEYELALKVRPGDPEIMAGTAEMQWFLGRWDDSLDTLTKAMEVSPREGRLACFVGGRRFGLRDYRGALDAHQRAIQLVPDRTCPYQCKALIYLNWDGDATRTLEFLQGLPPTLDLEGRPPINYPWVIAELVAGRYAEALARLSRGSSEAYDGVAYYVPKDLLRAQVHGLQGQTELQRVHYDDARRHLEKVIAERPADDRLHGPLGVAYAGLGRREDALREGELGLELLAGKRNPAFGFWLRDMAQIRMMLGDHDEAIEQLEQVLSVPSFFSAEFLGADPTWEPLRGNPRFQSLLIEFRRGGI